MTLWVTREGKLKSISWRYMDWRQSAQLLIKLFASSSHFVFVRIISRCMERGGLTCLMQWERSLMESTVSVPLIGINYDISYVTKISLTLVQRLPGVSSACLGGYSVMQYFLPFLASISPVSFLGIIIIGWLLGT